MNTKNVHVGKLLGVAQATKAAERRETEHGHVCDVWEERCADSAVVSRQAQTVKWLR